MISASSSGSFKTDKFLAQMAKLNVTNQLNKYGQIGVTALANATPVDTGMTAHSWYYEVSNEGGKPTLTWKNSDVEGGAPIAILIQYGHGTKNGGYVQGRDYINPAIQPVFDAIAQDIWKVVTSA